MMDPTEPSLDVDFDAPVFAEKISAASNRMKGHVRTWDLGGKERERELGRAGPTIDDRLVFWTRRKYEK